MVTTDTTDGIDVTVGTQVRNFLDVVKPFLRVAQRKGMQREWLSCRLEEPASEGVNQHQWITRMRE
jgi:hypothetical protein